MTKIVSYLFMGVGFSILFITDDPKLFDAGWILAGVGIVIHFYRFLKGDLFDSRLSRRKDE